MYSSIVIEKKKFRLDSNQIKKVVKALFKHVNIEQVNKKHKSRYFDLQIDIKDIPKESKLKPKLISLKNPYLSLDSVKICYFSPDPEEDYNKMIKKEINNNTDITIIGLKQLRRKYKTNSYRRQLCKQYDLFFAPRGLLNTLAPLIGKPFFDKKKQPAGISIKKGSIEDIFERAVGSTRITIGNGSCVYIHIGSVNQSNEEIEENIITGMEKFAKYLNGWDNIKTVHVKTDFSISLPIYNENEYSNSDESDSDDLSDF